jgi:hypothetical protein
MDVAVGIFIAKNGGIRKQGRLGGYAKKWNTGKAIAAVGDPMTDGELAPSTTPHGEILSDSQSPFSVGW